MTNENVKPATAPTPFKVKGDWSIQSDKLKAKFPTLTDDDLKFETGKEAELLGKVGKRLNKNLLETTAILEKEIY
ncbi:MAG: hypothetical protein HYI21_12490 [Sediminibacterium sp. Gen4]|jgi:hypothetical protein|uniref:hypothetical protein n=1 Tax=unclassified Sediminibacterium TaxID=2635961 RepID=UPI0015BE53F0|nr:MULTISPECIES: hypothetical protein [unclassified Sediminibacterium]MBW0162150.1 hypothetical protein [Sediminibacterium sp.]MBW0163382.1 hypothetical protein [Sediminibacterium sp.]NWK66840.1 hypothetical protein [Sediminibacterium sp. Gen4]